MTSSTRPPIRSNATSDSSMGRLENKRLECLSAPGAVAAHLLQPLALPSLSCVLEVADRSWSEQARTSTHIKTDTDQSDGPRLVHPAKSEEASSTRRCLATAHPGVLKGLVRVPKSELCQGVANHGHESSIKRNRATCRQAGKNYACFCGEGGNWPNSCGFDVGRLVAVKRTAHHSCSRCPWNSRRNRLCNGVGRARNVVTLDPVGSWTHHRALPM